MNKVFFKESAYIIVGLFLIYLLVYLLGSITGVAIYAFYTLLGITVVLTVLLLSYAFIPSFLHEDFDEELKKGEAGEFHVISLPLLLFFSFSLTSYLGWCSYGEGFMTANNSNPLIWLAYGVDNFVRAAFF
ncbi:hypothetical protein ACTQ75_004649, partial [Vibrio alginolyticus]